MNGYSNNGFTQSLNGILSLTDGLGTTIENGTIITGDITGEDIVSSTVTTASLKSTNHEISGNLTIDNNLTVGGLTNFNDVTDASSLLSTASVIINGGLIIEKNIYSTDVMSNNLTTGNIGCGNLNSSNNITCIDLKTNTINCKKLNVSEIENHYKNKICGYINIGIAPYLSIPLIASIMDTTNEITNFNLQTYLINSNNNSLFIQPYYSIIFYNNENILQIIDNSTGSTMLYNLITFNQSLLCTKIIIQYKNINI